MAETIVLRGGADGMGVVVNADGRSNDTAKFPTCLASQYNTTMTLSENDAQETQREDPNKRPLPPRSHMERPNHRNGEADNQHVQHHIY